MPLFLVQVLDFEKRLRAAIGGLRARGTGRAHLSKELAGEVVKPAEQLSAEGFGGLRAFFCPGDGMRARSSAGRLFCVYFDLGGGLLV